MTASASLLLAMLALPAAWGGDFLAPDKAFAFEARPGRAGTVAVGFDVADGYYLYRERLAFEALPAQVQLGTVALPPGHVKFDETFQKEVETYRGRLDIQVPVQVAPAEFVLKVTSQGCADQGLCYPPQQHALKVQVQAGRLANVRVITAEEVAAWTPRDTVLQPIVSAAAPGPDDNAAAADNPLDQVLRTGRLWQVAGVFLVAGLLLAFTPCVLPMLPILSSLIVGQGNAHPSRWRALLLSALYVLGMALVYTVLGVLAGLAGEGLAAHLQQPAVLVAFALLMVGLSLSMFGVYELRLPVGWQTRLSAGSSRLPSGQAVGVLLMGGLSALIVSPCVAAPLAGALLFISRTQDVLLGGTALFALALGMGLPLLLVGGSAGRLLPKAGVWMEGIKQLFGFVLLGVAAWVVGPALPVWAQMLVWAILFSLMAAALWRTHGWFGRGVALLCTLLAAAWVAGAASGGRDLWQPLGHLAGGRASPSTAVPFQAVKGIAGLDAALARADRPVMLDFYADWCVSCKEMERFTFADARVQQRLGRLVLLRADVTANDPADRALLKRFGLFGPPGIVFFAAGQELAGTRVIGFQSASEFIQSLDKVVP